MHRRVPKRTAAAAALLIAALSGHGVMETWAANRLTPLSIEPGTVTVSGLSSGGAMAVQFHAAHSTLVQGAGVLAAGPYLCAEGSIGLALGRCMKGGEPIPTAQLLQQADRLAEDGAIDPVAGMTGDRVWLYRGAQDPYVHLSVADALEAYYRARVGASGLVRVEHEGGGHNFPTSRDDAPPCSSSEPPFIANCGLNGARLLLEHLYGPLAPGVAPDGSGSLVQFDQRPYAASAGSETLDDHGWLYVPTACAGAEPKACRLHVVFHGCQQGASQAADAFVQRTGYLQVAESNRIVALFPQVKPTAQPLNPLGCWDWWGYEGEKYGTRSAPQIRAVKAMIDDLIGASRPAP
jgi:poly(3-hydroxybutyrate) depolymerase